MEDAYPPKLPDQMLGHARVCDRKNSALGGPATLSLSGSQDSPQLYAYPPDSGGTGLIPRREDLIRFCREVLAFYDQDYGVALPPWMPKNAGIGSRSWFLSRYHTDNRSIPLKDRFHYGANGSVVRYGSKETAQKAADKLNAAEKAASANDSTRALDAIATILRAEWPGDWASAMRQREAVANVIRSTGRAM